MHMMRQFPRDMHSWDNSGEQETLQQDDERDYIFLNNIMFESRLMTLLFLSKNPKFSKN